MEEIGAGAPQFLLASFPAGRLSFFCFFLFLGNSISAQIGAPSLNLLRGEACDAFVIILSCPLYFSTLFIFYLPLHPPHTGFSTISMFHQINPTRYRLPDFQHAARVGGAVSVSWYNAMPTPERGRLGGGTGIGVRELYGSRTPADSL